MIVESSRFKIDVSKRNVMSYHLFVAANRAKESDSFSRD